jgi:hypothetical protein
VSQNEAFPPGWPFVYNTLKTLDLFSKMFLDTPVFGS